MECPSHGSVFDILLETYLYKDIPKSYNMVLAGIET